MQPNKRLSPRCFLGLLAGAISAQQVQAQQAARVYFQPSLGLQVTRLGDRGSAQASNSNSSTGLAVGVNVGLGLARSVGLDLSMRFASNLARVDSKAVALGLGVVVRSHWPSGVYARLGLSQMITDLAIYCIDSCGPQHSNRVGIELSTGATVAISTRVFLGPALWLGHTLGGRFATRVIGGALTLVVY